MIPLQQLSTPQEVSETGGSVAGVLFGEIPGSYGNRIRVDHGLDTTAISPGRNLDPLLLETQYLIEMDNRLGFIVSNEDATRASISFVDDDNIASYYLSRGTDREYVGMIKDTTDSANQTIAGPRGTRLVMKVGASLELNTSDYLFDTIGVTETISTSKTADQNFKTIKSNIRVTGVNTGYRIDIPVKFCKKTT